MLQHGSQRLDTLRLRYEFFDFTDFQLDSCIKAAIWKQNMFIYCERTCVGYYGNKLPAYMFWCNTLVDLRIQNCVVHIPQHCKVSLLSLKKLYLEFVEYGDGETLPRLISGCPVLELLRLEYLVHDKLPAVKYPPSLVEADIYLVEDPRRPFMSAGLSFVEFVNGLCNVKWLGLKISPNKFSGSDFTALTNKFNNLIRLDYYGGWSFLYKILENADFLKHLLVRYPHDFHWSEPPQVPKCFASHLETVKFVDCCDFGTWHEYGSSVLLVAYVLKNASVLKKIVMRCNRIVGGVNTISVQDIESSPERASTECEILFQ